MVDILLIFSRQGCKKLILVDFDKFEESSLNRQRFCDEYTITDNKLHRFFAGKLIY